ncbi:MAG: DsbE family thiol:disulfide interchange protein [Sphingomonadaceae bacterium]|nr:DsbE family thiol:disulfide interchange protein [Sphingomonadaceae bacterium]
MKHWIIWTPLALFIGFLALAASGLIVPRDTTIESQMIGQPVPEFALAPALPGKPGLTNADLATGQPRLLNVFASWCVPCIAEAPQLMQLRRAGVQIDAIAIRDRPADIAQFLARHGDPYRSVGADNDSRVQLSLGSSGVPETFVVDGDGVIRHQHIGDIRPEDVPAILAALEDAQ